MSVQVGLPRLLAEVAKSDRSVAVEAETVDGALDALCVKHPELRVHLFDESGSLRPNVNCFHNDQQWRNGEVPLIGGDVVRILQAVSGGGRFR